MHPLRTAGWLVACLLTAVSLGACGGSSPSKAASATSAAPAPAPSDRAAAMNAYRDCLRAHGAPVPTGRPSPDAARPTPGPDQQQARQACANLRPPGGSGGGAGGNGPAFAAYRSCLSDHGVVLPSGSGGRGALDRTDPKVAAALATCRPLLPTGSGAPGG